MPRDSARASSGHHQPDRLVPSFHVKPLADLIRESEHAPLKRALGPLNLTTLGIGSIIGTGIFVLTGTAASQNAGPALVISMIIAAVGCVFAGLCYSELAAMIPVAGSAYTYAYATTGELFAWIIGWDLTLEYAMGASTVSSGWSNHFIELLDIFHIKMPLWLAYDHWTGLRTAQETIARQMAHAADPSRFRQHLESRLVATTRDKCHRQEEHISRKPSRQSREELGLGVCQRPSDGCHAYVLVSMSPTPSPCPGAMLTST